MRCVCSCAKYVHNFWSTHSLVTLFGWHALWSIEISEKLGSFKKALFKWATIRSFFHYFLLFNTVDSKNVSDKFCHCLDSNRGPLESEATALPTEPTTIARKRLLSRMAWASSSCDWEMCLFKSVFGKKNFRVLCSLSSSSWSRDSCTDKRAITLASRPVWPDAGIKSSQKFQLLPKMNTQQFLLKSDDFQNSLKKQLNIWAIFKWKCVSKNFQKSPNLVTLFKTLSVTISIVLTSSD